MRLLWTPRPDPSMRQIIVKMTAPTSLPCLPPPPALPWCPSGATSSKAMPPAAAKVEAFLARALEAVGGDADITAGG